MDEPPDRPKKRGRPRVAEPKPGVHVATWLAPDEHDKIIRLANKHELSVSKFVRLLVRQAFK